MRKHTFEIGEYYHIYNRGVDKRNVILDEEDSRRFMRSLIEFNTTDSIGSIYENSFRKKLPNQKLGGSTSKLVTIIAHCINPNHFHLLLTPVVENGIQEFMRKMGGYTMYFNEKNKRSGALFQGRYKSKHIQGDKYLLHLSAYINMNNRDLFGGSTSKLSQSSFEEYVGDATKKGICDVGIVLDQFPSREKYRKFALESWADIQKRKKELKLDELDFLPWDNFTI